MIWAVHHEKATLFDKKILDTHKEQKLHLMYRTEIRALLQRPNQTAG